MTTTTAAPARATQATFLTALKAGLFLLVMMRLAGGVYGAFWGLFSLQPLEQMLGEWHVVNYASAVSRILGLSIVPLSFALLFVLSPLIGWWIYSRVEKARQNAVGWSIVGIYLVGDAVLSILTGQYSVIALIAGAVIIGLYIMFWMGIGFNLAKLFRAKL